MIQELATRAGTMYVPDNDCGQYWWLVNTGASPEDEFIEAICDLLDARPKGTAVDVGANFGCWTLPLAAHAHSVIAIEPQRCCIELIARSVAANRLANVRMVNAAAGARAGRIMVPELDIEHATNFGGITLGIPHHEQPDAPMREVQVVPLDTVLNGEPVSFIKIDVEGFEGQVLEGARATIVRCKPILLVETDHPLSDGPALISTIEALGYATEQWGGNTLGMPL